MEGKGIDAVVWLCIGVVFLFLARCLWVMSDGGYSDLCSTPFLLIGVITFWINLRTNECSFNWIQRLTIASIWTGIICFLWAWWLSKQSALPPAARAIHPLLVDDFSIAGHVLGGLLFIFFGGVSLWFVTSPPNMGKAKNLLKGGNILSSDNDSRSVSLGLSKTGGDASNGDMIDQALSDILNADTNLQALMRTDPNLAGKIQQTFDYYDPNAGVFRSWARRLRGEGRGKLLEVLNKEQQLLIEQAALFEQKVMEGTKKQAEFKLFLAQNVMQLLALRSEAKLNDQAFGKGMFVKDFSDVNKEKELSEIRLKEHQAKSNLEEMREEARIKRNLDATRAFKMNEHSITDDYRKKREKALIELDAIEARTDISEKTKAALKISKENEAENLRRIIEARERKAASDEESFLS